MQEARIRQAEAEQEAIQKEKERQEKEKERAERDAALKVERDAFRSRYEPPKAEGKSSGSLDWKLKMEEEKRRLDSLKKASSDTATVVTK